MSGLFTSEQIQETIAFHGHTCPGLAIGIRAAEYALNYFDAQCGTDVDMLTVSETDMCGVDAIQYLTECTLGKGNFIHRDYGKTAFSFFNRANGKAVRIVLDDSFRGKYSDEMNAINGKKADGTATEKDLDRLVEVRKEFEDALMKMPLSSLFVETSVGQMPRGAAILDSLTCEGCGESVMESRTRRFGGKVYCIPCFAGVDQKI